MIFSKHCRAGKRHPFFLGFSCREKMSFPQRIFASRKDNTYPKHFRKSKRHPLFKGFSCREKTSSSRNIFAAHKGEMSLYHFPARKGLSSGKEFSCMKDVEVFVKHFRVGKLMTFCETFLHQTGTQMDLWSLYRMCRQCKERRGRKQCTEYTFIRCTSTSFWLVLECGVWCDVDRGTSPLHQSVPMLTRKKSVIEEMIDKSELAKGVRRRFLEIFWRTCKGCCREFVAGVGSPTTFFDNSFRILEWILKPDILPFFGLFAKAPSLSPFPSKPTPPLKAKPAITEHEYMKVTSIWEEFGQVIQNST